MSDARARSQSPAALPGAVGDGVAGVLDELSETSRTEIERRVRELRLPAGTTIFEVGEPGDALYIVKSGLVDVSTDEDEGERRILTLGPGEILGEQSLLTGHPRSARARSQTGVTLWRLDHADFLYLLSVDPELGATVARVLSERLGETTRTSLGGARGKTVVVHAPSPALAARTGRELAAVCARLLGADPVVLRCGPADLWDRESDLPGELVADPDDLAGSAVRAVRRGGLVLLLCPGEVPDAVVDGTDWVVTVGDPGRGAARARRRPTRELADPPTEEQVGALGRELCGRRVGLALGSGGIRGWAHAGILEVLVQERIPIDFVSGASAGALAGGLFVAGMDPNDMLKIPTVARDVLFACFRSYRPSARAILSGRPFITYLRDRLGADARIEDLPKPFIVATTDLDTREPVHLDAGPLPEAIVASASVNGIFPPVTIDGRRLVDGGATDPIPVSALRERGADIVIAVNVMAVGKGITSFYTPRFRIPMPGLLDNLLIGLDTVITQAAVQSCKLADVVVEPGATDASWHDVLPAAKYAGAGAAAMRAAIPGIRRLLGETVAELATSPSPSGVVDSQ